MEREEGCGTRSAPTTIDEIILQDNEWIVQRKDRLIVIRQGRGRKDRVVPLGQRKSDPGPTGPAADHLEKL